MSKQKYAIFKPAEPYFDLVRDAPGGGQYDNRFCSIIKIADRKIAHWRDYMDSLAAWNALTSGAR